MVKLEQWFKRNQTLKDNYFKFMGDLLKDEHAVIADSSDNDLEDS